MKPSRYHGALIALHWLLAVLLLCMLAVGSLMLKTLPNSAPEKIFALQIHMILGGLILVLTIVRLVVRLKTPHPALASSGNAMLDKLAPGMHWALYLLVLGMATSGIGISVLAGLPEIVFQGYGNLPADFNSLPPRIAHGWLARLLMAAIGLHFAAALYHQYIRRDGLLARMWLGNKEET